MAEQTFARIQAAAKNVNAQADAITAEIAKIEERLQAAGAGIDVEDDESFHTEQRSHPESVHHPRYRKDDERTFLVDDKYSLVYTRVGVRYRIAYIIEAFEVSAEPSSQPRLIERDGPHVLADSDRQTRLRAAHRLGGLVEVIADRLETKTSKK